MTTLTRPLGYIALLYWFVFWLLNGMDKFMHGATVAAGGTPLFVWFGKDRGEQFGKYFERLDLPTEGIAPLLATCGVLELGVAVLFGMALLGTRMFEVWLGAAFAACALMFVGFSAWDVVAGDRAELLEHGTYLGVVFITAAFLTVTQFQPVVWRAPRTQPRGGLAVTS
ncbi:MAG: hypothetical protein KBA31_01310 [Alphaproteobacteria bacterium]|nr:hypothetical protein [Alphaproteobacteria bacterium]